MVLCGGFFAVAMCVFLCVGFVDFWQLVFCFHFVVTFLVCKIEGSGKVIGVLLDIRLHC